MSNAQPQTKKAPPVAKIRIGNGEASIWEKTINEHGIFREITVQGIFKRKDGSYGYTDSFDLNTGLAAHHAFGLALTKLQEMRNADIAANKAAGKAPVDEDGVVGEVQY